MPGVKGMIKLIRTIMYTEYSEATTLDGYRCRKCDKAFRGRANIDICRELGGCPTCTKDKE